MRNERLLRRAALSPIERHQVRTLVVKDALALASIFAITLLLAIVTYFLFQSYTTHRRELADRWFGRGQKVLTLNQPLVAINDFHSALLYAPGQRSIEVALASALASAGKLQEATAYFNTLWEAEPGNGEINVQLARLAVSSGNEDLAKRYYHAAIYGNWEGDGYIRRRDTRLELVHYLISRGRFDPARSELLVAAGNAPSSDLEVQALIAGLLVEDHSLTNALALYQQLLAHAPNDLQALEGAAKTAYDLGNYQLAHHYLLRVVSSQETSQTDSAQKQVYQDMLHKVSRIILLDPSPDLPPAMLMTRLLEDREIARRRFQECSESPATAGSTTAAALASLAKNWANEPKRLTATALADDTQLQQAELQIIYQTEKSTAAVCGAPSGDDAILLQLATVPSTLNDEPDHE